MTGTCNYQDSVRSFIARISVDFILTQKSAAATAETKVKAKVEVIRILGGESDERITALEYGPYDNGFVLTGLSTGRLYVYDPNTLKRVN